VNRSLADDIRSRTDAELRDLLLARPDLARPAPLDLTGLAARAITAASVRQAVERLDTASLHVLEAMVVAGGATEPVQPDTVAELLGVASVDAVVARLHARALLWRSPEGLRVVRAVAERLGPSPAGLGPTWRDLAVAVGAAPLPDDVDEVLRLAPAAALGIVERLTWGPPTAVVPPSGPIREGAEWLAARGIVVWSATDRVTLPRDVALARRNGRLHREVHLEPPALDVSTPGSGVLDAAAGERIRAMLGLIDDLAHAWGSDPPRVLRSGGLSVRDLGRLAAVLDVATDEAAFVAEIAHAAGLLADDGATTPVFLPTPEFDGWAGGDPASRWATVAAGWWAGTRAASLVGTTGRSGPINALGPDVLWPPIRTIRAEVLGVLAGIETGSAVSTASLVRRLVWDHPLRDPATVASTAEAVLREAGWLGLVVADGLSGPGRALAGGGDEAALAAAAEALLAPSVDHVVLQADLTVVAPGPVASDLGRLLRLVADVESRGGATVWRFTPGSIRRGLDSGLTADDLLETLARSSRTPVPQPLEYLVRDVARRHGHTRVGSATAYLRSDDEAALATILGDRALAPAMLRRIAPTVLVSRADPADLLDLLREGGYAPVQESVDGSIVVAAPGQRRTQRRARRPAGPRHTPLDAQRAEAIVAALRAVPARSGRPGAADSPGGSEPEVTTAALHELAESGDTAWVGYADANGRTNRRLMRVAGIEGGRVRVVDEVSGLPQVLLLHRITSAAPAG
jgi:hypothetical protein